MEQETPPLFKTWLQWYFFILSVLVIQIVLYYFITESYR